MKRCVSIFPDNLPPIGLTREQAAGYLGIGTTLFDDLVKDGQMPSARKLRGAVRWDRLELDVAFRRLPRNGPELAQNDEEQPEDDPWSRVRA